MQLCKEFNKTTLERKEFDMIVRGGHHRQHFEKEMKLYLHKLDKKLTSMEDRFKEFFTRYNIPYGSQVEKNGGKQRRRNLISAISDLLKLKDEIMRADHRLKSTIYSYDLADNDYYKGVMQVEQQIKDHQKELEVMKKVADKKNMTGPVDINNQSPEANSPSKLMQATSVSNSKKQ